MEIIIMWIIFSFVVGVIGSGRNIGFGGAFFLSLLLSPFIGLIIALISKNKGDEKYKEEMLEIQKRQQRTLSKLQDEKENTTSVVDELKNLIKMKDDGFLTEEEFKKAKDKLLGQKNLVSQPAGNELRIFLEGSPKRRNGKGYEIKPIDEPSEDPAHIPSEEELRYKDELSRFGYQLIRSKEKWIIKPPKGTLIMYAYSLEDLNRRVKSILKENKDIIE